MTKIKQSPYETLGLPLNATIREIKVAYKKAIRQYTPEHDPEKFMAIRDSYEELTKIQGYTYNFPVYKKPLEVIRKQKADRSRKTKLPLQILSTVFETPYDTLDDIVQQLEKSAIELGFIKNS